MITPKMNQSQRQEFCVRWNSHLGSIGAAFPQLLAGQRFVDVTLACEGHSVHCHRLVLAACSSYFESILAENPCKHPIIILPSEIKLWEIQALVDFMYKGEVNVTQAGLPQLLHCAEQLRIRGLYGSDAALNLNQLKALTSKAAAFTMPVPGAINACGSVGVGGATNDSTETDDTAGTNSTATTTTATAASALQQLQAGAVIGQIIKEEYSMQETNGGSALMRQHQQLQQQHSHELQQMLHKQQQQQQQQLHSETQSMHMNTSNAPTEDESADDSTSNAYDQYEDYAAGNAAATVKAKASNNSALVHLDSTVEEDHNYVAHDEDSYGPSTIVDHEQETSGNSSLLQASLDSPGGLKRVRRSEASLAQAAKCVSKGQTFQTVSNIFNIPVSTIRFYMARKGILPKRKRGRGASTAAGVTPMLPSAIMSQAIAQMKRSGSVSPILETMPPYHMVGGTNVSSTGGGVAYKVNEKSTANVL